MAKREIGPETVTVPTDDGKVITFEVQRAGWLEEIEIEEAVTVPGGPSDRKVIAERFGRLVNVAVSAVTSWDGVTVGGQPAECTQANRLAFFSMPPNLDAVLSVVNKRLGRADAVAGGADRPNVSGDGSGSGGPIPASSAATDTSTVASAQTNHAAVGGDASGSTA